MRIYIYLLFYRELKSINYFFTVITDSKNLYHFGIIEGIMAEIDLHHFQA